MLKYTETQILAIIGLLISGRTIAWLNQKELVRDLCNYHHIKSDRVAKVMYQVDRGHYVKQSAYDDLDDPVSIGYGAYFSLAHMHAFALETLKDHLKTGNKALDVGSGSGYLTVCMALIVGKTGSAIGVEHIPELVEYAKQNVMRDKPELLTSGRVKFVAGDGRYGVSDGSPYDAIYVGATASEIPEALLQQLKKGGRMVIPLGRAESRRHDMMVLDKTENGTVTMCPYFTTYFEPLTEEEEQWPRLSRSTKKGKTNDRMKLLWNTLLKGNI